MNLINLNTGKEIIQNYFNLMISIINFKNNYLKENNMVIIKNVGI